MKRDVGKNVYESLAEKYGMSIEQAKANCRNIEQMASEVDLEYQFDTQILTNTFDAHRLTMFAKSQGLMKEMAERILRAYFTESKHIGDHETLTELAREVGLDREAVAQMLASDEMSKEVRGDEQEAAQLGIRSVPFFLINKKYALTGAQPTEVFVQALQKVMAQDGPFKLESDEQEGAACDENGCEIPKK